MMDKPSTQPPTPIEDTTILPPSSPDSASAARSHDQLASDAESAPGDHHPPAHRSRITAPGMLFNVIIPLLILAAGAGFVVAVGTVEPKARPEDDQTRVGRLRRLPAADVTRVLSMEQVGKPLELRVDGVVVPFREVQIAAEVSGRIIEKSELCRAGNYVTAGQLLCRIDPTDYEQEILRLTRVREQEYEALKEVDQEVANTKATLEIAKQDVELAQREVTRLQSLPRGFASESEMGQAQKAVLASTQSRITIENQMRLLSARRGRLEASERLATTQLETANINLQRCEIRSPADGVIVREDAELNSFIQRGSPIITLEDISKAEVAVNLRMDQLYWVLDQDPEARFADGVGQRPVASGGRAGYSIPPTPAVIEYEVAGMGGKTYRWDGTLVRYDGIGMDTRSRTVPVTIEVDAPDRFIREQGADSQVASPTALVRGMYVKVRLLIKPQTPLVAIPSLAIRPGNRVWQFQADPSVLDDPVPEGSALPSSVVDAAEEASAATDSPSTAEFDPTQWVPGRVTVRGNLTAVDSLWMSEPVAGGEDRGIADQADQRRYWICDVRGGELSGGDWVVISPLGDLGRDLGDAPLPVRVPLGELRP